jgi:hypothetical protein
VELCNFVKTFRMLGDSRREQLGLGLRSRKTRGSRTFLTVSGFTTLKIYKVLFYPSFSTFFKMKW